MSNMILGSYTFVQDPIKMDVLGPDKFCSHVQTYSGVGYFSWGTTIVGKVVEMSWDYMRADEYDSLMTLYTADAPVVFDPQDGTGKTYNVEIENLSGRYYMFLETGDTKYRRDVTLKLLILSEVEP